MLFIFLIFLYFPYNPFACGGSISAIWPARLIRNLYSPLCTLCAPSPQMEWRFPQPLGFHLGPLQGPALTVDVADFASHLFFQVTAFTPQSTSPLRPKTRYLFNLGGILWLSFSLALLLLAGCLPFLPTFIYFTEETFNSFLFPLCIRSHSVWLQPSPRFEDEPFCCLDILSIRAISS